MCLSAAIFIFNACEYDDSLSPYLDTDFLTSTGLADWRTSDDATYMNFTGITDVLPDGGTDAYRLELLNLMPNGDFTNSDVSTWFTTANASVTHDTSGVISGNALRYSVTTSDDYIRYSLPVIPPHQYKLLFDYSILSGINPEGKAQFSIFKSSSVSDEITNQINTGSPDGTLLTNQVLAFDSELGTESFVIGTVEQQGYLDNIRLVRTDNAQEIYYEVPYMQSADDELPLISGTYKFSLWIKSEAAADLTPVVPNRFPARGLTLRIAGVAANGCSGSETAYFTESDLNGEWTSMSVSASISIVPQDAPATAGDPYPPVIRLSVTPRDNDAGLDTSYDIGSLLVGAPSLVLSSDMN